MTVIAGGWLNHHWIQLGYQLADSFAGGAYSFFGTLLILYTIDFIGRFLPALRLRVSEDDEVLGIDEVEIGEFAYDYVELIREVRPMDTEDESESRQSSAAHAPIIGGEKTYAVQGHYTQSSRDTVGAGLMS
ncbi:hypothetical protein LTR66_010094 [Elasticomyces elasticus]|nr:hypothetical protein LTR66_010094 [Elasticomyces elasticus]